jgi:hypothetical protein
MSLTYPFALSSVAFAHTDARNHGGYPDALTHYALDRIKAFTRWLNGQQGFIGEVGIPQNLPHSRSQFYDEKQWAALGERWYKYVANQRFWVTAHGVSERYYNFYDGGYYASIWLCPGRDRSVLSPPFPKVVARRGYQAALVSRHRGPYRGVNFPNAQKWIYGTHSRFKPGRYGIDYWYPTINDYPRDPAVNGGKNSYEYLYSEGVRLIRLGFRWERIQPRLGYGLNKTELGRMKHSVRNAGRAGLKVILDLHNYGGYWATNSGGADGYGKVRLNSPGCTKEHFRGLWRRLSAEFRGNPTVIAYDLMNEPIGHGGIATYRRKSPGSTWQEITSFVHASLRRSGDKKTIIIPTYAFWPSAIPKHHPGGPWIKGDAKVRYSAHCFFDRTTSQPGTGGGKYKFSYAEENQYRRSQGY